jgi:hypothetical protein
MDTVTIGAVLLAVVGGGGEALGSQLWEGLQSLVRRRRRPDSGSDGGTGQAELAALERQPADQATAVMLARVLLERAAGDAEFDRALRQWWQQAEPLHASSGDVRNSISGGTIHGPVIQGRDFSGITFGPVPPVTGAS